MVLRRQSEPPLPYTVPPYANAAAAMPVEAHDTKMRDSDETVAHYLLINYDGKWWEAIAHLSAIYRNEREWRLHLEAALEAAQHDTLRVSQQAFASERHRLGQESLNKIRAALAWRPWGNVESASEGTDA